MTDLATHFHLILCLFSVISRIDLAFSFQPKGKIFESKDKRSINQRQKDKPTHKPKGQTVKVPHRQRDKKLEETDTPRAKEGRHECTETQRAKEGNNNNDNDKKRG